MDSRADLWEKKRKKMSLDYNTKWNILNEWYSHWNLGYVIQFSRKEQVEDGKKNASGLSARPFIPRGGFLIGDTVLESDLPMCLTWSRSGGSCYLLDF